MYKKIIFIGILFLSIPQITFGYIDPGTGSYIIQLIAGVCFAGGAGIMFFGKTLLHKIRHPFRKENFSGALEEKEKKDE